MNRNDQLQEEFVQWLERYSPPRAIADNPTAAKAEINALMRAIIRFAPTQDYLAWLQRVTETLDYQMKTRAWPTVSEVGAVCSNLNKHEARQSPNRMVGKDLKNPMQIAADHMEKGEAVGDEWLYGRNAVELQAAGLVNPETLRKYRSALYFSAKAVYGEEIAKRREADWIAKHDRAESFYKDAIEAPKGEPFKRMPVSSDDQWAAE